MKYIIGIDEVGRGALAGPVVVAAAAISGEARIRNYESGRLRDSKKLSAKQRDIWFSYFKKHPKLFYAIAKVYHRAIDGRNISHAANMAALRALERLFKKFGIEPDNPVFLDGGLFAGNGKRRLTRAKTVIKGDEKITAIKIASVIAKVHRDSLMRRLAKKHPNYGFEIHKGYGTKKHIAAIRRHGPSKAHRMTFLKNFRTVI